MKPTNLIWVLALAGSVAACNSGSPLTNVRETVSEVESCDLTPGAGACVTAENIAVYKALEYTNDDGEFSTCNRATSAIGSDCVLGAARAEPPIAGCPGEAGIVLSCFPNCQEDVIAAAAACVALCTQDATEEITGTPLSDECVACTGDTVACGAAFCTDVCINDSNAPACIDCRCDNNCIPSFDTCSGLPSNNEC